MNFVSCLLNSFLVDYINKIPHCSTPVFSIGYNTFKFVTHLKFTLMNWESRLIFFVKWLVIWQQNFLSCLIDSMPFPLIIKATFIIYWIYIFMTVCFYTLFSPLFFSVFLPSTKSLNWLQLHSICNNWIDFFFHIICLLFLDFSVNARIIFLWNLEFEKVKYSVGIFIEITFCLCCQSIYSF